MKDLNSLKDRIKEYVTLGDILKAKRIISGTLSEEQFSCRFHGVDRKKSARYYRDTDSTYCWVCKEKLDLFSYVAKAENMSFMEVLDYLVKSYEIKTADLPDAISEGTHKRLREHKAVKYSNRKLYTEKMRQAINVLKDEVPPEKYQRMVLAFMFLKYMTPDEKFDTSAHSLKDAILRLIKV